LPSRIAGIRAAGRAEIFIVSASLSRFCWFVRERAAGFSPGRVFFPLYYYWFAKRGFGKVPTKIFEKIFPGTQKNPVGINPIGQNTFYNIMLHHIIHTIGRK